MKVHVCGVDIGKTVFDLVGVTTPNVKNRTLSRGDFLAHSQLAGIAFLGTYATMAAAGRY